jgi:hypothetical protein
MARKIVDIGVSGNDGTGDSIREAFRKTNDNFNELYAVFGQGGFLKFTDLSDTPDTLTGEGNKLTTVNSLGTAMIFRDIVSPLGTVSVTFDADSIKIDTLSSRLVDDPLPKMQNSLNASNAMIGGLRAPVTNAAFTTAVNEFNTAHDTAYNADAFAINKGYADAKYVNISGDTMTGYLNVPANATGIQAPRASEVVSRTGGDMTGVLNLSDHPGALAGLGTPNGTDDLQAATKYYVDNASYSSTTNLFVTTQGDDTQARTPLGKEGRDRSYAYASVNRACQKAEELVNAAPFETGPYRQLIAYNAGESYSEVTRISAGVSGTTRVFFTNNGGNRVDQGALPKPDIVSGKLYYGADGSSSVGEDFFDLQDVEGEFIAGENLEYGQAVKKIQISIIVESGIYEEDYPIRIPANCAVVGDELRRVIIRPADRPSRSPWADIWFRRDLTFDGLDLTSTLYGYHYLTDPSDPLSQPKNNRDMDVFLCNDAVIIRQITCQGHGGFMMVLDPEGQILTKSAYIQQAGSFSGSINKQRFAGGQFVDGFAGNVTLGVNEKLSDTEFLVTGSERAPVTPCSFVVDGKPFKVDAFTDDGTGYGGSRQLINRNLEFIKAEVIGYIDSELAPQFTYNRTTCARDIGLIIDALGYDLVLGTNYNSIRAGQAYYRGTQYDTLPAQVTQTTDALNFAKGLISELLAGNSIAQTRAVDNLTEIIDIINNGVTSSDTIVYGVPTGTASSILNAKNLLLSNIDFIREETIAYISDVYPDFIYDEDKFRIDTTYIIEGIIYDLMYGSNVATREIALQYYDASGNLQIPGQTTAAYSYTSAIAQAIITNLAIEYPKQELVAQIFDVANPSSNAEATTISTLIGYINTTIFGGRIAAPEPVYPTFAGVDSTLTDIRILLLSNKERIKSDTIVFLDQRFSYNKTTCARDTGYIAQAIAHDIYYGGNLKTIQAALSYFNASASSKIVLDNQLINTLASIEYINEVIIAVVNNISPTVRYQQGVLQFVNLIYTDGPLAASRINELFAEMLDILSDPPVAREARALLLANKSFIQAETIAYINNKYVSFDYNEANVQRDIGYAIDAIGYDLMFGSNFATSVIAKSYYRENADAVIAIGQQKAATIDAFEHLKGLVSAIVSAGSASTTNSLIDSILNVIKFGVSQVPTYVIPVPVGYSVSYQNARDLISTNRAFLQAELAQYITNNFVGLVYDPAKFQTEVDVVLDSLFYDLTYQGNLQARIAARSYVVEVNELLITAGQASATSSAYTYLRSIVEQIAIDTPVAALQVIVAQIRGTAGSVGASGFAGNRIGDIITTIDGGLGALPAAINPSQTWVGSQLQDDNTALQSAKIATGIAVTDYINSVYGNTLVYNEDICSRDVGFIISNVSSDLLYGGTYLSIRAANRYQIGSGSTRVVLNEQLPETLDAINYAKYVAQQVLIQEAPLINFQTANAVATPVTQVFDAELDGAGQATRLGQLMDLIVAVIQNPVIDYTTIVANAAAIIYPTYKLVLSDTTPITNPLRFTITGYVSKALSTVGDGSYDVVLSINSYTPNPLIKTRYRIYGNSNTSYTNDSVECVASTSTTMTFRYPSDPGTFGTGTTIAEYTSDFQLLSAGNTSMCSNDFTQINDAGYGLIATNIGLVETVSVFSYYCWTAYYANNGGQIRSLNGSNAYGQYGIISAGSDPLEIPDAVNLADNMIQVANVYKIGIYDTSNVKDELAVYIYNHDYSPYNVSEVEINHGAGIITALDNTSLVGGSSYTTGTYLNVPLTGGTGSGALANIVVSGGQIVTASLVSGGLRYTNGDVLSVSAATVGGTGSGFSINVSVTIGNGIARYEVAGVTDVSSTVADVVTGTPVKTGPTGGKFYVTYSFVAPEYFPKTAIPYVVAGNANTAYNGTFTCTASTATSVTLEYTIDPGAYSAGVTTVWGLGNVIRLNINTGGNNNTAANGLAVDLTHNQYISVRGNQNFKFYEVDDTNPVRPSTALTFVGDPTVADAIVYRVLAYGSKGPLNEDLNLDESVLGFDTTYDYIKLLGNAANLANVDPANAGKTLGSTIGDTAVAVDRVSETGLIDRINTSDMIFSWDGKLHLAVSYEDLGSIVGYAILRFTDITAKSLPGTAAIGLNSPIDPDTNLDIAEPPTLRIGLASTEPAEIIVRISTCRVTGHDFLDIGTGTYNQTNYPNKIYGAPKTPNQALEVEERTRGRCFYVTTDQDGIFRVGRFFTVDQGTGRVTFAASIALSNLDGLGFKRGVTVSEFSNDDKFTDGANDALPTEAATQGYIDRRLGMDRTNVALSGSQLIGPGYMDRAGILGFEGPDPLNMGGFRISNLQDPVNDSDAATQGYVNVQQLSDLRVDTTTSPSKTVNDLLVWNGVKWVNAETITTGDIQTSLSGKNLALNIKSNTIINTDINSAAAIAQSKLAMNSAVTRVNASSITQADRGLVAFNSTQFTLTSGWAELQTATSATTGVTFNKIQYVGDGTLLGNRSGSASSPYEITPAQVVTDGDGIKNASFAPGSVGGSGRVMILTGVTPNAYSTTNISTTGQASSIVQSDGTGVVDVQQLKVDSYKTLDTSGTTLQMFTPGAVTFLTATGTTGANSVIALTGTTNATALTTSSTTTFSPVNAAVTLSPTGTGTVTIAPASVGTINNINIGGTTRGNASFTTLNANSQVNFTANIASNSTGNGTVVITGGLGVTERISAANIVTTDLTVTNTITGSVTGNAGTATKLATARSIALSGDVTGTVTFDGSAGVTIAATIAANSVELGTDTTGNYV